MSVSDNFNRADGGLGSNWTTIEGTPEVVSNKVGSSAGGAYNAAYWSGNTWNADQTSEIVLAVADLYLAPIVRGGSGPTYYGYFNNGNTIKRVAGADTSIISGGGTTTLNDVMKITATGTTIEIFKNGVSQGSVTDSAIASGSAGVATYGTVGRGDDWVGTGEVAGGGGSTQPWYAYGWQ